MKNNDVCIKYIVTKGDQAPSETKSYKKALKEFNKNCKNLITSCIYVMSTSNVRIIASYDPLP